MERGRDDRGIWTVEDGVLDLMGMLAGGAGEGEKGWTGVGGIVERAGEGGGGRRRLRGHQRQWQQQWQLPWRSGMRDGEGQRGAEGWGEGSREIGGGRAGEGKLGRTRAGGGGTIDWDEGARERDGGGNLNGERAWGRLWERCLDPWWGRGWDGGRRALMFPSPRSPRAVRFPEPVVRLAESDSEHARCSSNCQTRCLKSGSNASFDSSNGCTSSSSSCCRNRSYSSRGRDKTGPNTVELGAGAGMVSTAAAAAAAAVAQQTYRRRVAFGGRATGLIAGTTAAAAAVTAATATAATATAAPAAEEATTTTAAPTWAGSDVGGWAVC